MHGAFTQIFTGMAPRTRVDQASRRPITCPIPRQRNGNHRLTRRSFLRYGGAGAAVRAFRAPVRSACGARERQDAARPGQPARTRAARGDRQRSAAVRPPRGGDDGEPLLRQPARRPVPLGTAQGPRPALQPRRGGAQQQPRPGRPRALVPDPHDRAEPRGVADLERHPRTDRRRQDGRLRALGGLRRSRWATGPKTCCRSPTRSRARSRSPTAGSARRRARPTPTGAS